ncbi:MAG: class I SAM-dependent methyltransferase [Desulfuromonadales bacterium]|nr:class I SAM-dependent methyltransferase [Desulfuromonadales bacterium]
MPRTAPFNTHHQRYDAWFTHHEAAYWSELLAVRALLPWQGLGLEIGVGTGRFAAPLGIRVGLDPSRAMLSYAAKRGVSAVLGTAEAMPFLDSSFDYALNVTTICFLDNVKAALTETYRILKHSGHLVVGFIDRTSPLGKQYQAHKAENVFYREATFYSAQEVAGLLKDSGFSKQVWLQTLSSPLNEMREPEPLRSGSGQGAFLAVRATKS